MASWNDLAGYLRTNYRVSEDNGTHLILLFDVGDSRSQLVHITRATMGASNGDWAVVASVFGRVGDIDLSKALQLASEYVVGGVAQYGDALALRHAVPLAELDIKEFEEPFRAVLQAADLLEEQLTGRDDQ